MKNTTCLLGAGASYFALPIEATYIERLEKFKNELQSTQFQGGVLFSQNHLLQKVKNITVREAKNKFIQDIDWAISLRTNSNYESYDECAQKELFEKGNIDGLNILKIVLSSFFLYEQAKNPVDPRYACFLQNIYGDNTIRHLTHPIYILSWNYDNQLEKTFWNMCKAPCEQTTKKYLNIYPSLSINDYKLQKDRINLVKLNGDAACSRIYIEGNTDIHSSSVLGLLCNPFNEKTIENILWHYVYVVKEGKPVPPTFSFQFERNSDNQDKEHLEVAEKAYKWAKKVSKLTKTLVVIGYSFPEDNNEVDQEIIKNSESIIIQNLEGYRETLEKKVREFNQNAEITFEDPSVFYIP
jgi:hypothetical protein